MAKQLLFFILIFGINFISAQENWHYLDYRVNNYKGDITAVSEDVVYIVTSEGKINKTIDGGITWTGYDPQIDGELSKVKFFTNELGYTVGDHGTLLKTSDAGDTWNIKPVPTTEDLTSFAMPALNNCWMVGKNGIVLHSVNAGETWTLVPTLTTEDLYDVSFRGEKGYIVGSHKTLLHTIDGGETWTPENIPAEIDDDTSFISISMTESKTRILGAYLSDYGYNGTLYIENNDTSWTVNVVAESGSGETVNMLYFQSDTLGFDIFSAALLCDCCFVKINKYNDEGKEMSLDQETDAAHCTANPYAAISFANENVGYVLLGGSIIKTSDGGEYTVLDTEDYKVANGALLYPNPISGEKLTIEVNKKYSNKLTAQFFDLQGNKVFEKRKLQHHNVIQLDPLTPGVYFVDFVQNGKVVFTKKIVKAN